MLDGLISAGSSILGGIMGDSDAKKNRQMQMDLAKNSIKYRVEDAKNAGIHPLYAIGAPSMSATPVSSPMGDSIAQAGRDIGKSISSSYEKQLQALNLEHKRAEIDKTKAMTADFVMQSKRSSNLAQVGAGIVNSHDKDVLKTASGGELPTKGLTPQAEFEDMFGSAGEIYGLENLYHSLKKLSPKAWEAIELKLDTEYKNKKRKHYNRDTGWR